MDLAFELHELLPKADVFLHNFFGCRKTNWHAGIIHQGCCGQPNVYELTRFGFTQGFKRFNRFSFF